MALYIPQSILHLARSLYVRPETYGPTYVRINEWTYVCMYICLYVCMYVWMNVKVKWSPYRPGVAQRVGRGIALLFHDCDTRRKWVVSSTPRPQFTHGKDPVPILQEAGWAPGPVWTGGKSRLHRDSIPDRPAHSQSLYRMSYPAHVWMNVRMYICISVWECLCVCVCIIFCVLVLIL